MSAQRRDIICLAWCGLLAILIVLVHASGASHAVQRPVKVAVIVLGLTACALWRRRQTRRTLSEPRP